MLRLASVLSILALLAPAVLAQEQPAPPPPAAAEQPAPPAPPQPETEKPPASAASEEDVPARRAECVWLGQRIVSLLWRDDVNTAREQARFYDRFGCPGEHLAIAFRCVIRQSERQPQQTDLGARVYGCWLTPEIAEQKN